MLIENDNNEDTNESIEKCNVFNNTTVVTEENVQKQDKLKM